ncbi:LPS assembly lipoprotein LptE [Desulfobulbus alkaliphilus]|uniref:LPS assembly lipoprotein LptE n=1 Tax=Desulfobulbus alkaliphilus TaxID=869814 RepID=UPI001965958A|nr:LPS assembly lipoprotein LptE [Desulfobulbus alkaliphilus]MBM9537175.1 hypothetical protein [Desulfobulbus alkaliphilus]
MLKTEKIGLGVVVLVALFLGGCGYYFPHIYSGPARTIYVPNWENRTSKLGLDNDVYQSLARWFQKSEALQLTRERQGADMILAGEITSIDLPSVSWANVSTATDIKVSLYVRYVLKDLQTGDILWEVPRKLYTEDFSARVISTAAEDAALERIIEDMAEEIYIGTLNRLRKQPSQATTP